MNEKQFEKLVDKNKNQVFILQTALPSPLSFAIHLYFVTNKKGEIHRWEIMNFKNPRRGHHLHKNLLPHHYGFKFNPRKFVDAQSKHFRFKTKLTAQIEGQSANDIIEFLEEAEQKYPFTNYYKMIPGPNSNTFVQWVLDNFTNEEIKLPFRAYGKNYFKKHMK